MEFRARDSRKGLNNFTVVHAGCTSGKEQQQKSNLKPLSKTRPLCCELMLSHFTTNVLPYAYLPSAIIFNMAFLFLLLSRAESCDPKIARSVFQNGKILLYDLGMAEECWISSRVMVVNQKAPAMKLNLNLVISMLTGNRQDHRGAHMKLWLCESSMIWWSCDSCSHSLHFIKTYLWKIILGWQVQPGKFWRAVICCSRCFGVSF